ncbi:hypothetical protein Tco_1439904 [Tanacetum coccineum]
MKLPSIGYTAREKCCFRFSSLIWYDEDIYDLRSVETEFLAIVFNDNLTSNETLFCEPTYYKDGDCTRILQRPRTKTGNMALPPRDQRYRYLGFEGLQYTKGDIANFETRFKMRCLIGILLGLYISVRGLRRHMRLGVRHPEKGLEEKRGSYLIWLCSETLGPGNPQGPASRKDLAAKKWTKLVKYQSSGILCVIVVMLEYRRIYNTHPAHKLNLENLPSKIPGEFLILILLNSRF